MLSPAHLSCAAKSLSDEFSWIRRGRKNADSWESVEIPLDVDIERYSVRLLTDGGELIRETHVNHLYYVYPVALKEQDFGNETPQFLLEVRQINDLAMPGAPARLEVR